MSRFAKVILGVLTLFPIAHIMFFFFVIASSMADPGMMASDGMFPALFISHFAAIFLTFGLMMYYVIHALTKNDALEEQTPRMLWALILFMGNMLAMPIYYFMYILPEGERDAYIA